MGFVAGACVAAFAGVGLTGCGDDVREVSIPRDGLAHQWLSSQKADSSAIVIPELDLHALQEGAPQQYEAGTMAANCVALIDVLEVDGANQTLYQVVLKPNDGQGKGEQFPPGTENDVVVLLQNPPAYCT